MRPAGAHFRRHSVVLHARDSPDGGTDKYVGWQGHPGTPVSFPDAEASPPRRGCNVNIGVATPEEVAERPGYTIAATISVDVNPDLISEDMNPELLRPPDYQPMKFGRDDGASLPDVLPGKLGLGQGEMSPVTRGPTGVPVSYRFRVLFQG